MDSVRVLYVEDDPVQAMLVKHQLEDKGVSVEHVAGGEEALARLFVAHFDVVLTDYYMPGMNGVELMRRIDAAGTDLPVVILTAGKNLGLAFDALREGATDFISKDDDGEYLSVLYQVLLRAVERHCLLLQSREFTQKLEYEKQLSFITLDALSQGVVVLDQQNRVKYSNRCFRDLFSVPGSVETSGMSLSHFAALLLIHARVEGHSGVDEVVSLLHRCIAQEDERLEITLYDSTLELHCAALHDTGHALTFTDITHRKQEADTLDCIIRLAPVAMIGVDRDGRILLANERAGLLMGAESQELVGSNIEEFVPAGDRGRHARIMRGFFGESAARRMRSASDVYLQTRHGEQVPVEITLNHIRMGEEEAVLATVVDISARKEAERVMLRAHQLTQSIIEHSPFSLMATDIDGRIIAVSPALERLLHYSREELVERESALLFHREDELEARAVELSAELGIELGADFGTLVELARRGEVESREWTYQRSDESTLPVNLTVTALRAEDGEISGYLLIAYDISEQKAANEYIEHIAHHDGLTDLPNRTLMTDRLQHALLRIKRYGGRVGVLVLDLDHFKRINDTLGHMAGDELLKVVAERLKRAVRESDTVCRMGGDEFVVILPEIRDESDVERVCEKILELMAEPVELCGQRIVVSTSIGLSVAPQHGETIEQLLEHADTAMYQAKQRGRNGYQVFSSEDDGKSVSAQPIEHALYSAFQNDRLSIHYQPQISTLDGHVTGVEALVRWEDADGGWIPPDRFIHLAESTGFIVTLGDWLMRRACEDIEALRRRRHRDFSVAVNISQRQFWHADFVDSVKRALLRTGLPPQSLMLELPESLLVTELPAVSAKLEELHACGVKLAVDDFGTTNASPAYACRYPLDMIKIDRSFLATGERGHQVTVTSMVAVARELGVEVLAEGVETPEQLEFISARGCHRVQGFLYSPAVAAPVLEVAINQIEKVAAQVSV
ncbi:EAL domain-containing protein [Mangrovimicrobium sediminis]|uniref:EAL domain-containing protein n=1 Tax=Mangrovimicrobium sediminis TaxID=2562682 RepID=A0A4Z0M716_9GAMM|nr:EAL domain-containing protein [Haliea sp. SAOS-164]TGD75462.1 EAL domain-containing protein [Haliea sp. SAOS-164]